jgi:curved DNA-binding protein CbpA
MQPKERARQILHCGRSENKTLVTTLCLVVQNRLPVLTKRVATSRDIPRQFGRLVNFYRVLGVRPGADGMKIKAAYRALVKQFHPDFNAGDARAEQRTKEIHRAYQTLGEPEARAVYDVELARQRAEARGRFLKGMATGLAVFLLTISLIPLATYLVSSTQRSFDCRLQKILRRQRRNGWMRDQARSWGKAMSHTHLTSARVSRATPGNSTVARRICANRVSRRRGPGG